MPVGKQPQYACDQDQAASPGRLEREGEAAERQRALMEPVVQDRVGDGAGVYREEHAGPEQQPTERVAWPPDRHQHPDCHRGQQGHRPYQLTSRLAGQRHQH